MGRILAIDYGTKRTGLAVTDPLKIIASPLDTIASSKLLEFINDYLLTEELESIVVGMPKNLNNAETHVTKEVQDLVTRLKNTFKIPIHQIDERFTSKMAFQSMIDGGLNKKKRGNKEMIDKLSATIILQSYLDSHPS